MKSKIAFLLSLAKSKHILSLTSNGINAVIGVVTLSILFRHLTREDMGNWGFFLTILLLVDTFRSGFLSTAFVKFFSGSTEERKREIIGSTWFIAIMITLFFAILNIPAYFVSGYIADPSFKLFLQFFSINYVFSLPFFVSNCILQGKQRYDRLLFLNFANQGCFLLLILLNLKGITIHTVLYCYLSANFVSSSIALFFRWTDISMLKYKTRAAISEIYNFGKYSVGTNLSANLLGSVDSFIIKFFLGPSILAVYNAGTKLVQIIEIPLRSFVYTAMPTLSACFNSNEKAKVILVMKKYIGMITVALMSVSVLVIIFADLAILIFSGPKYVATEAPNILRIFMVIAFLYPAERFFAVTLDVIHMPKVNLLKIILMLVVTILTDWLAIVITGNVYVVATASVFSTLTGLIVGYFALNYYYQKFTFFDMFINGYREIILLLKRYYSKFFGKKYQLK
jgi:O-antigen/teichoic acid export membrane protein